jgi:hypothetical protein
MKRIFVVLFVISLGCIYQLSAVPTANSLVFSGSYLLRVNGAEAVYWNPALITQDYQDIIIPGVNQTFQVANNSFDLDNYNYISGRYLTLKDKNMILRNVGNNLMIDAQAHVLLFGLTFGNLAFATSMHGQSDVRLSKSYIKLALFGNEETDYVFTKKNNQLNVLSYQDVTVGIGDIEISKYFKNASIPEIKMGVSASALVGIGTAETEYYRGSFHSGMDGLAFEQDIKIKTGLGGIGTKALIGFASQPINNLEVGMSFDNLFGVIRWLGSTERRSYSVTADSTYASDLEDDIYTQEDSVESIGSFNTLLPLEMRLGAKYQYRQASLSMDWVQGFAGSVVTSSIGKICLGVEYQPIHQLPIRMGFRFGNSELPWGISYGLGFHSKFIDCGFGIQTLKSLFPGNHSKGISFSSNLSVHY